MRDLPTLKRGRTRKEPRRKGDGFKLIEQGFFKLGPNAKKYPYPEKFFCPAGPGMGNVPVEGRWYDVNPYLLRCLHTGDLAEGTDVEIKARAKLDKPPAEPKGKE